MQMHTSWEAEQRTLTKQGQGRMRFRSHERQRGLHRQHMHARKLDAGTA